MGYIDWCKSNNCDHAHCPLDCEHPQPFVKDGVLMCGRCWFVEGCETKMVACTPETCKDATM